jgi:hypothetical protein
VSRIGTDNPNATMAADYFALLANRFDARTDLHARPAWIEFFTDLSLLVSIGDPTSGEVVRGEFNLDLVTGQDSDVMHPHLSGDMGQNLVAVFELDTKHCVR